MARGSSFTVLYLAGAGALTLLAALLGMTLTGERHSGLLGSVEVAVLVVAAVLYLAAGVGAVRAPDASWPFLVGLVGLVLVAVLTLLTFTTPDAGSAVLFEAAALVIGAILVAVVRRS